MWTPPSPGEKADIEEKVVARAKAKAKRKAAVAPGPRDPAHATTTRMMMMTTMNLKPLREVAESSALHPGQAGGDQSGKLEAGLALLEKGKNALENIKNSSGETSPIFQISVPCRGQTHPEKFDIPTPGGGVFMDRRRERKEHSARTDPVRL